MKFGDDILPQSFVLQSCSFVSFSVQSAPPLLGTGLVHVRVAVCLPPPHSFVQLLHSVQLLTPPLMAIEMKMQNRKYPTNSEHSLLGFQNHKVQG